MVERQISQQFVFAFVEGRDGIPNTCWGRCGVMNGEDADLMLDKQAAEGVEHGPVPPSPKISSLIMLIFSV